MYDLIQAVAVGKALEGSIRAAEYVRDTNGDKPTDKVEITDNVMTDSDREMMRKITKRLEKAETIQIVEEITTEDVETARNGDSSI